MMRKTMLGTIALVAAMALSGAARAEGPEVGKAAPTFTATDSNGKTVNLADFKGKLVVLEWTNHGCPYVRKHYNAGNMQKTQKAARELGAVWLSIISSAPGNQGYVQGEEANKLTADRGAVVSHVLLDPKGAVGRIYAAKTTPHMFIIGQDGNLLYKGGIDSIRSSNPADIAKAKNYMLTAFGEIKDGKPIADKDTVPYGCTIHYTPAS